MRAASANAWTGVQLLSVYAILALLFYFLPDVHPTPVGATHGAAH